MRFMLNGKLRCGQPGSRGPCKLILRGDTCAVHDNLDAVRAHLRTIGKRGGQTRATQFDSQYQRNARSHVKRESLQRAGRAGYDKVGGDVWWAEQTEKARQYRLRNPSNHERLVIDALLHMLSLDVQYDREVICEDDPRAVDFVLYRDRHGVAAIEVTESATRATFGRDEKLKNKIAWLEAQGLPCHIFYGGDDLQTELERLGNFLETHNLL